ncbi:MAG: hypothetical protein R3263_00560, partial [Myxococcota bacterium]|nr:hypothetical protein [Myxococcota bacterium]
MPADFQLYESILWTPAEGYTLLDHHLRRLLRSAAELGFPADRDAVARALDRHAQGLRVPRKVRLAVDAAGAVSLADEAVRPSTP